MLYLKTYYRP